VQETARQVGTYYSVGYRELGKMYPFRIILLFIEPMLDATEKPAEQGAEEIFP